MPASLRLPRHGDNEPSQVPGPPAPHLPCSPTPAGPSCQAVFRHASAAPALSTAKAPTSNFFQGSITRLLRSLSTLRRQGHPCPAQDSLPAAGYALPDGICYPRGGYERFLMPISHLPPFPGLAWRDDNQDEKAKGGVPVVQGGCSPLTEGGRSPTVVRGAAEPEGPAASDRARPGRMLLFVMNRRSQCRVDT